MGAAGCLGYDGVETHLRLKKTFFPRRFFQEKLVALDLFAKQLA